MKLPRHTPPLVLASGIVVIVAAIVLGQARFALFLIFPVVYGGGPLAFLGGLLVTAGLLLYFFRFTAPFRTPDSPLQSPQSAMRARKGGVILIGPIPVIYGSEPRVARWMLAAAILMMAIVALLMFVAIIL